MYRSLTRRAMRYNASALHSQPRRSHALQHLRRGRTHVVGDSVAAFHASAVTSVVSNAISNAKADGAQPLTPMVQQYVARKQEYPDCMLLFQVGDFYEFFGHDARRASHLLNLALTRKSKQANAGMDMCGFPLQSLDSYVEKLVMHHGVKVAICNQIESAASARRRGGYQTLVERQVVRVVTPGSLVEEAMLSPDENNYLAALFCDVADTDGDHTLWGLAWADLSTGEFVSTTSTTDRLANALLRCSPREILLPESLADASTAAQLHTVLDSTLPSSTMRTTRKVSSFTVPPTKTTAATDTVEVERAAASAILDYVAFTHQREACPSSSPGMRMREPVHLESSDHMIIDASAWKALELGKSLAGTKQSSLLHCINATVTPAGSRLLASQLAAPLMNLAKLEQRLDGVTYFVDNERLLKRVRRRLARVFDVERSLQRLLAGAGTPRDLKHIATTIDEARGLADSVLEACPASSVQGTDDEDQNEDDGEDDDEDELRWRQLSAALSGQRSTPVLPPLLRQCREQLLVVLDRTPVTTNADDDKADTNRRRVTDVAQQIHAALSDDVTALNSKSGFVRAGFSPELDHWRCIANGGASIATENGGDSTVPTAPTSSVVSVAVTKDHLQQKYRAALNSTRLRVGYHVEKGFFIDIPHDENNKLLLQQRQQSAEDTTEAPSGLASLTVVQSMKNSVRYRNAELSELNRELAMAALEVTRLERELFEQLRDHVLAIAPQLHELAAGLAQLDVCASHAQTALDQHFVRPLLDASRELHIQDARHAVVEAAHRRSTTAGRAFVPNTLHLVPSSSSSSSSSASTSASASASAPASASVSPTMHSGNQEESSEDDGIESVHGAGSCWLLTGPNMGGKSTFLRQNAQLVVLAQMGSFVPARFARVGIVDKLFCRVGAADDLASDKSTFMMEMQDTATILTQATPRSLVLMDEVGRGTAVNDGIAIAGAVLEALCAGRVRALFATHFTVLSELLAPKFQRELQLYRMEVLERQLPSRQMTGLEGEGTLKSEASRSTAATTRLAQLVFSHRVVPGLAAHSYGLQTAALAGCPPHVVARAAQLLKQISTTTTPANSREDKEEEGA